MSHGGMAEKQKHILESILLQQSFLQFLFSDKCSLIGCYYSSAIVCPEWCAIKAGLTHISSYAQLVSLPAKQRK